MRTAGPAPAVSWRKQSRKRPRCPFVSYKPPAAPPSEGTRRGGAARPEEAAEEGPPAAPGSPRRCVPLGPHACPPALPEPQVRGRRGAPLGGGWAGGARGPCASAAGKRAGAGSRRGPALGPPRVTVGTLSRARGRQGPGGLRRPGRSAPAWGRGRLWFGLQVLARVRLGPRIESQGRVQSGTWRMPESQGLAWAEDGEGPLRGRGFEDHVGALQGALGHPPLWVKGHRTGRGELPSPWSSPFTS